MKGWFQTFQYNKKGALVLAIAWTILIFIGCSMPGKELPKLNLFDQFDKMVHFIFFVVFFICWNAWKNRPSLFILVSVLYGFGIEFYQLYCVAGRSFDVWDGVADSVGALVGYFVFRRWNQY